MIASLDIREANAAVPAPTSRLIAVASGKGGVGKTWLSITLAHALSLAGKRALLFDGALGLANVDVQLGVTPERDLGTFLSGHATLADTAVRFEPGGFDIVAGRSGSGSLSQVAPSRLAALRSDLQLLGARYDVVIMDMGAGIDRTVRSFAIQARTCLVVTTDEPTSISDAYAFIKMTALDRPGHDLRIVVNMASSREEGEQTYGVVLKACREFLKLEPPLAGVVRRDPRVHDCTRHQCSILTRYPESDAAIDVAAIAAGLLNG